MARSEIGMRDEMAHDLAFDLSKGEQVFEDLKTDALVYAVPGIHPDRFYDNQQPNWDDAGFRDFYEIAISKLTIEMTKEMLLQYIPTAEEKYPLIIETEEDLKSVKVILRFGPFYNSACKNYMAARNVFGEQVKLLQIRTFPPTIKITGVPQDIASSKIEEFFPQATAIHIETKDSKIHVVKIQMPTFERTRKAYLNARQELGNIWLNKCVVTQEKERVQIDVLSPLNLADVPVQQ